MARKARESGIPSRELFEKNPLPMWVYDIETLAFLAVNAAAVRHYGYSRRKFLAMTIKEIRPPEDIPALLEKVSRPVEGYDAAGTWRHRKKDGTIIDVEIITHTITFAGRRAKLVLANDVTERKRLERSFNMAAREWRKTFDAMNEAVAWIDRNGRIVRCNKALTILTKKNYRDIIGHHCEEVVYDTAVPTAGCPIQEVMTTHRRATATLAAGARIYKVTADPLFEDSGEFIGAIHFMSDVTQQELAEAALRRKEHMLSEAQRIAHIGSWEADFKTAEVTWSEEMHRIYGTSSATFAPTVESFVRMVHPRDRKTMADWIRGTTAGKRLENLEFRVFRPDGTQRWVRGSVEPLLDAAGKPIGAIGAGQDITERKKAEDRLKASEEKFRTLFETANDAIFILDMHGHFIDLNRVAHERLGYSKEEMLAKSVAELDPPEFAARVPERLEQIGKYGKAVFESAHLRKDGTAMPVEINARVIDFEGRKALFSVIRDITARKRSEDALREQKAFTEQLIQGSSVATFVINDRHEVILWNKACEELTGFAAAAVLGGTEVWKPFYAGPRPVLADLVLDPDPENFSRLYPIASRSVLVPEGLHAERWIENLNGKDRYIVFDAAPIRDGSGRVIASIETIQDFTAQKLSAEAIAESEKRYRDLFDNANDMIQSVGPDGRILYVNAAWSRVLGYGAAELAALNIFDIIHPDDRGHCRELLLKVISGESSGLIETRFVARDGSVVDVEGSASARRSGNEIISTQGIFRDVTERKKLQEDLYRISRDWEETFNTITDMVTVHDKDFNIIRANKAAEKILGLPLLHAQPVKCFEYYHGTGSPPAGCPSCASLVTGQPSINEIFEPHLGRHLEIRAIPRLDSAGQIAGLIHVVRDISERKQAEKAKQEQMRLAEFGMHIGTALNSEGSLQDILGACTDFMVTDLGAAFARIWTVSPDAQKLVLQASSGIYTHRDGPHGLIPLDKNLKIPTIARTRIPHLTNAVIGDPLVNQEWAAREGMVAFAGYPLLVGNHLVGVMGFFSRQKLNDFMFNALESVANNIALGIERCLGEEALKRYSEELASLNTASNDLLALASLPELYDLICRFAERVFGVELVWLGLIDADGIELKIAGCAGVGVEYLRTMKVTLDDSSTGRGPTGLAIQSKQPRLASKDSPEFAPWRAAAAKHGFESSLAVPLISPTEAGTCIGALNFYSRIPDYFSPDRVRLCQIFANQAAIAVENAKLIEGLENKVAARTREIEDTNLELQHVNRELELRRLEAESASRTKSDFLANMSHELRTPLNAIIGFSDLMVRGMAGPLAAKPQEYLGDILAGGKHLLSLINDILDLSKVEAGKMEIEVSEFDLAELIDRSLVLFREKAAKHRIDLRAEIAGAIGPMSGDERKIRQVLYNLLSNGVKFTADGGSVAVRARTVSEDGRDCAEISVFDTGIGISPADQERLFQPFSQLSHHLTKEYEGTGLGLALSKSLVEMHAGRIWVESAPGRGSTFTFRVPLRYEKGRC